MTPMQAIKSATSVAAEHMALGDQVGALREGLRADVIAVRGDPLADVEHLRIVPVVIKEGTLIKSPTLKTHE